MMPVCLIVHLLVVVHVSVFHPVVAWVVFSMMPVAFLPVVAWVVFSMMPVVFLPAVASVVFSVLSVLFLLVTLQRMDLYLTPMFHLLRQSSITWNWIL